MKKTIIKRVWFAAFGIGLFLTGYAVSSGYKYDTDRSLVGRSIMFISLIFLAWVLIKAAQLFDDVHKNK